METEHNNNAEYQVLVCNIYWDNTLTKKVNVKNENLPNEITLTIPNNVLQQANKNANNFNDIIETFVYNLLYRKFNHEVNECSIILPSNVATAEV